MPTPLTLVRGPRVASALTDVPNALDRLAESHVRRSLILRTPRSGPLELSKVDDHVLGIARIDHPNGLTTLVCTVSSDTQGELWFGSFKRERITTASGRPRTMLSRHGEAERTLLCARPHPGGIQAAGTWLAVACEGGSLAPCIEIYDVSDPGRPKLHDQLTLKQATGAGWVAMAERTPGEYAIFIGGPSYARKESWVYTYRPASKEWRFEGTFTGKPSSSLGARAFGPQNGGSLFLDRDDAQLYLITQGTKGTEGNDVFRERVRCFRLGVHTESSGRHLIDLEQQPEGSPENYVIDAAPRPPRLGFLFFRSPGLRWGSTFFADEHGELILYATARNPLPGRDKRHELEIIEVRARMR